MKNVTSRWIGVALALTALPAAASAQDIPPVPGEQQVGTRFLQEPETVEAARGRAMQKKVAGCVYRRNKDEIEELLAHSDFYTIDFAAIDRDSEELFDDLSVSNCIGKAMRDTEYKMYMQFQYSTMRNLLAEEAYLRNGDGPLELAPDTPRTITERYGAASFHPQIAVISDLADCIVHQDARRAHEFLRARPASDKEREALESLGPIIVDCMKTDQDEVTVSTSLIRQIVADGLWSRSHYGRSEVGGEVSE